MRRWTIHNCWWNAYCRKVDPDPPHRITFETPYGRLIIAYRWKSLAQLWLPFKGYTKRWSLIAWHPRRSKW